MRDSEVILCIENIGKQYRLGLIGTGTLSHDLNRWWSKVRGKEDPYLRIGETNDRSTKANSNYVWALKNINFDVNRGEVLGIIGKNGAGKSTLLKVLSRVTSPTTGKIKSKGRIASLLEVGTGFHPEMTGRENIYLNGAILGMTTAEVKNKIEDIIDFSGCLRYIDTPVKRYSSGMKVRLAFAVAAHLEPDILVVDEVLAVGDADFQKRAIGKMQEISNSNGRTVLFVSHNMASVKTLCDRAIVLENGLKVFEGDQNEAVDYYLKNNISNINEEILHRSDRTGNGKLKISRVELLNKNGNVINSIISGDFLHIKVFVKVYQEINKDIVFGLSFKDHNENIVSMVMSDEMNVSMNKSLEKGYINIKFSRLLLRGGLYYLTLLLSEQNTMEKNHIDRMDNVILINVLKGDIYGIGRLNRPKNCSILEAVIE